MQRVPLRKLVEFIVIAIAAAGTLAAIAMIVVLTTIGPGPFASTLYVINAICFVSVWLLALVLVRHKSKAPPFVVLGCLAVCTAPLVPFLPGTWSPFLYLALLGTLLVLARRQRSRSSN